MGTVHKIDGKRTKQELVFSFSEKILYKTKLYQHSATETTQYRIEVLNKKKKTWKLVYQVSYNYPQMKKDRRSILIRGTFKECKKQLDKIIKSHFIKG